MCDPDVFGTLSLSQKPQERVNGRFNCNLHAFGVALQSANSVRVGMARCYKTKNHIICIIDNYIDYYYYYYLFDFVLVKLS